MYDAKKLIELALVGDIPHTFQRAYKKRTGRDPIAEAKKVVRYQSLAAAFFGLMAFSAVVGATLMIIFVKSSSPEQSFALLLGMAMAVFFFLVAGIDKTISASNKNKYVDEFGKDLSLFLERSTLTAKEAADLQSGQLKNEAKIILERLAHATLVIDKQIFELGPNLYQTLLEHHATWLKMAQALGKAQVEFEVAYEALQRLGVAGDKGKRPYYDAARNRLEAECQRKQKQTAAA